jgi:hypothetical protein
MLNRQQHPQEARRVMSTQKFPMVFDSRRAIPRTTAMAITIPTAAEMKL